MYRLNDTWNKNCQTDMVDRKDTTLSKIANLHANIKIHLTAQHSIPTVAFLGIIQILLWAKEIQKYR